jgi:hypothetical protein
MARKRYHRARRYYARAKHRASKMTIPLAPVLGIIGTPAVSNAIAATMQGNYTGAITWLKGLAGIGQAGSFDLGVGLSNWKPIAAGLLVHKGASMLGINRVLAKAKIPVLRV